MGVYLGRTPLENYVLPSFASRLRIELAGHHTREMVVHAGPFPNVWLGRTRLASHVIKLDGAGSIPPEMVRVSGFALPQAQLGLTEPTTAADFFLDRYEVTNRAYKAFVDADGYTNPTYWSEPFIENGTAVGWQEAIARFVDRTGRPGPSPWYAGTYPENHYDHPVSGVSWYEAMVYARFVGKSLPTYWHWRQSMTPDLSYLTVPRSNLSSGEGPARVGSFRGIGGFGTFDQWGNVREWLSNARDTDRLIVGGAWSDPDWSVFFVPVRQPVAAVTGYRAFLEEPRVTDTEFDIFARMAAYVYVPRAATPPYQPIIY